MESWQRAPLSLLRNNKNVNTPLTSVVTIALSRFITVITYAYNLFDVSIYILNKPLHRRGNVIII